MPTAKAMIELHRTKSSFVFAMLLSAAAATLPGCANFDLRKNIPWGEGADGKLEKPMQVAAFWTSAVQNIPDRQGLRGFGGRLYFYGKNPNKPAKVKGALVVYAFDETNRDPNNIVPDKKYVFTAEQLKAKYSKSELGHSYSVWLPWDEVGGQQRDVTLIARFTNDTGEMVSSEPQMARLPGTQPTQGMPTPALAAAAPNGAAGSLAQQFAIQQAAQKQQETLASGATLTPGVVQAGGAMPPGTQSVMTTSANSATGTYGPEPVKRMTTTTIPLSQSLQRSRAAQGLNRSEIQGLPVVDTNSGGWQPLLRPATAPAAAASTLPAQANQSAPVAPPGLAGATSAPPIRSEFEPPRVLGAPIARLESDRNQWPPRRAE
jgi:hypothetical protein